jgi:hypothetical protein
MPLVPAADTPPYARLQEQVRAAVGRCQEEPSVEFKGSYPWDTLRYSLVRTALAMANLRDGGLIVVGIGQLTQSWDVTGVAAADLATYDPDLVKDAIDAFASPYVEFELVTVECTVVPPPAVQLPFLVLRVSEFLETPVVCKRDGPPGSKLHCGAFYIRSFTGRPATRRVTRAEDMHSLLELAAEKRASRIIHVAQQVGLSIPATQTRFDQELEGL